MFSVRLTGMPLSQHDTATWVLSMGRRVRRPRSTGATLPPCATETNCVAPDVSFSSRCTVSQPRPHATVSHRALRQFTSIVWRACCCVTPPLGLRMTEPGVDMARSDGAIAMPPSSATTGFDGARSVSVADVSLGCCCWCCGCPEGSSRSITEGFRDAPALGMFSECRRFSRSPPDCKMKALTYLIMADDASRIATFSLPVSVLSASTVMRSVLLISMSSRGSAVGLSCVTGMSEPRLPRDARDSRRATGGPGNRSAEDSTLLFRPPAASTSKRSTEKTLLRPGGAGRSVARGVFDAVVLLSSPATLAPARDMDIDGDGWRVPAAVVSLDDNAGWSTTTRAWRTRSPLKDPVNNTLVSRCWSPCHDD
eukprot:PhM_4_TR727/c1_g1_i1/m.47984